MEDRSSSIWPRSFSAYDMVQEKIRVSISKENTIFLCL